MHKITDGEYEAMIARIAELEAAARYARDAITETPTETLSHDELVKAAADRLTFVLGETSDKP